MDQNVKTEGLFRIPPHVKLKEILREAYDRGQKYIVWKDRDVILPPPHYEGARYTHQIVAELDQSDTYGVHLAGGLIKLWYQELREPIVPPSAYRELTMMYVSPEIEPTLQNLVDLFSPTSEWSPLSSLSREILTRHLLPLLDAVAGHQNDNKMNSENLAVCFAPTLVCGSDQIEDVKMSNILRRLLIAAANMWPNGLRDACGVSADAFIKDIQPPTSMDDYEDPLYEVEYPDELLSPPDLDQQRVGIVMEDNEDNDELEGSPITTPSLVSDFFTETATTSRTAPPLPPRSAVADIPDGSPVKPSPTKVAPPLPPRNAAAESKAGTGSSSGSEDPSLKRKPGPVSPTSPIAGRTNSMSESAVTYTSPIEGAIPTRSRASTVGSTNSNPGVATQFKRKPVGKSSGDS